MKIKLLVFDFDGTISDARSASFKTLNKILKKHNIPLNKSIISLHLGKKIQDILSIIGVPKKNIKQLRKEFFKLLVSESMLNLKLCVSVKPLWKLKENYKLIVISNSEASFIKASIKQLKLQGLFNEVYCADNFPTKDKVLKQLSKKYKIKPKQIAYIGDMFSDVKYAKKAGCISIAIHNKYSWSSKKEIIKQHPDFIIKDFYSLKRLLTKL